MQRACPPPACWLNRPLMTLSLSLYGASGSRLAPSSIAAPSPFAHQCGGEMPSPMNMQANRCGDRLRAVAVSSPHRCVDSSHGSATDSPNPLSKTRRDRF